MLRALRFKKIGRNLEHTLWLSGKVASRAPFWDSMIEEKIARAPLCQEARPLASNLCPSRKAGWKLWLTYSAGDAGLPKDAACPSGHARRSSPNQKCWALEFVGIAQAFPQACESAAAELQELRKNDDKKPGKSGKKRVTMLANPFR